MKSPINKINSKEINIFIWIGFAIFVYNAILGLRFLITDFWVHNIQLYQQAFNYQDCGFITRGLIPSIIKFFNLRPILFLYILCNIFIALYVYLIHYIVDIFNIKHKNLFLIGFLFLFFGIPHFALDALRLDIILQTLCLLVFVLLHHHKIFWAVLISILGLFIHEAIYFLLVPIFFLKMDFNKKWLFSILLSFAFLGVVFFANKITKEQAIQLAYANVQMKHVPETYYIPQVSSAKDNALHVFKIYKMHYAFAYLVIYLMVLIFSFKKLFSKPILDFKWLFLFPLLICLVAADWFRWICFVYFLAMLNCLKYDEFTPKTLRIFVFITIFLGIPIGINIKYGIVPTFFHLISKII